MVRSHVASHGVGGLNASCGPISLAFSKQYVNEYTIPLCRCGETGELNNFLRPQSTEEARIVSKEWDEPNQKKSSIY